MSLIPDFSWKMSEDFSVFDYEGDDGNSITKQTRRQKRERALTREEVWRCSQERLGAEKFETFIFSPPPGAELRLVAGCIKT